MKVFAGIIATSSATLLFDSRMHASEGAKCFMACQQDLIQTYFRCGAEWDWGTDDFYRCYAKAEEEFMTCFLDEETGCQEGCGRICGPDFFAGVDKCYELVDQGIIEGDIPLTLCINKFALDFIGDVEKCICDMQTECTCQPVSAPFLQHPKSERGLYVCVYPEQPEE